MLVHMKGFLVLAAACFLGVASCGSEKKRVFETCDTDDDCRDNLTCASIFRDAGPAPNKFSCSKFSFQLKICTGRCQSVSDCTVLYPTQVACDGCDNVYWCVSSPPS
jgi:hypothetical protein